MMGVEKAEQSSVQEKQEQRVSTLNKEKLEEQIRSANPGKGLEVKSINSIVRMILEADYPMFFLGEERQTKPRERCFIRHHYKVFVFNVPSSFITFHS